MLWNRSIFASPAASSFPGSGAYPVTSGGGSFWERMKQPEDFKAPCGCKVRFDNDGLVRLEQCELHAMAADLHDVLKAIVNKSYLRPGKHEDCHVHPKLIEADRMLLHNLKCAEDGNDASG